MAVKLRKFVIVLLSMFLLFSACNGISSMLNSAPVFLPLEVSKSNLINNIRLITFNQDVLLLDSVLEKQKTFPSYRTVISTTNLDNLTESRKVIFSIVQLLPAVPKWDVSAVGESSIICIIEKAGGATNRLFYISQDEKELVVTDQYLFENFSDPRFVRYSPHSYRASLSAVSDKTKLVVFPESDSESYDYKELGEFSAGIIMKLSKGFGLVVKRLVPGEERNGFMPGILEFFLLDDQFLVKGEGQKPFGKDLIYEFDADSLVKGERNNQVAIFATGQENAILVLSDLSGTWNDLTQLGDRYDSEQLSRPAVKITSRKLYMAIVNNVQEETAEVLWKALDLD